MKRSKTFDVKKYRVKYYQENSERLKKKSRAYYRENREEIKVRRKTWRGVTVQKENTAKRTANLTALKAKPCTDCNQNFPACCMDFDHVRGKKLFSVSEGGNRKWSTVLKEISKCELVCANCHRKRTHKRRQK